MSRFHGPQEPQPMHRRGRNKGVQAAARQTRRKEATERNAQTPPERRSTKRARKLTQNDGA